MNDLLALFKNPFFYGVAPIVGVVSCWILSHIFPSFVKFNFDTRLEYFRRELLHKDKAAIISDLAVLIHRGTKTPAEIDLVNKHLFDLSLYLPPCLIHKMAHTICKTSDSQNIGIFQLLVDIRGFIDGSYKQDKTVKLDGGNIPHLNHPATKH